MSSMELLFCMPFDFFSKKKLSFFQKSLKLKIQYKSTSSPVPRAQFFVFSWGTQNLSFWDLDFHGFMMIFRRNFGFRRGRTWGLLKGLYSGSAASAARPIQQREAPTQHRASPLWGRDFRHLQCQTKEKGNTIGALARRARESKSTRNSLSQRVTKTALEFCYDFISESHLRGKLCLRH